MNLDLLNIRLSYQYGIIEFDQYREMMTSVRQPDQLAALTSSQVSPALQSDIEDEGNG